MKDVSPIPNEQNGAKMFSYDRTNGWNEIADFTLFSDDVEWTESLTRAGYSGHPSFTVGNPDATSFCFEVHSQALGNGSEERRYQFLVSIEIGGQAYNVAIPKLPDLLDLLRQIVPLAVSIDEWEMKKEEFDERLDNKSTRRTITRPNGA